MERKINFRKPKSFTAFIRLITLVILLGLVLGVLLTNKIKDTNEDKYVSSLIVFICISLTVLFVLFIFVGKFSKNVYKLELTNKQVIFTTYNYVYLIQKDECINIIKRRNKIVFKFSNGLSLTTITRVLFFFKVKKIDVSLINKRNFPNADII